MHRKQLRKNTPVRVITPRDDVPEVKAGAEGHVLAHRTNDDQVLIKVRGKLNPVSYDRTALEVVA